MKKRLFFKPFCTKMKKQMIAYQPCFYLNDKISYENPTTHHYVMSTISYNYTYKYTPAFTHTFNSIIKSRQNVLHCQILHVFFISTHKKFVTTFINNLHNFLNHEKLENRLYWNNQIGKLETTRKNRIQATVLLFRSGLLHTFYAISHKIHNTTNS